MNSKDLIQGLVTIINRPGVYCFQNNKTKEVWLTYTKNIAESILRNYNKITKTNDHSYIKKEDVSNWEVGILNGGSKEDLIYHQEYYLGLGYKLVSKPLRYSIRGKIAPSFKDESSFLYYAVLMGGKRFIRVLGVFDNAREGKDWVEAVKRGGGHLNVNYGGLKEEQKKLWGQFKKWLENRDKEEFKALFSEKVGVE